MSKKLLQALTLVLALALFAAGCGGTEGLSLIHISEPTRPY